MRPYGQHTARLAAGLPGRRLAATPATEFLLPPEQALGAQKEVGRIFHHESARDEQAGASFDRRSNGSYTCADASA